MLTKISVTIEKGEDRVPFSEIPKGSYFLRDYVGQGDHLMFKVDDKWCVIMASKESMAIQTETMPKAKCKPVKKLEITVVV